MYWANFKRGILQTMEKKNRSVFRRLYVLFGVSMLVIYISLTAVFLLYAQKQRENVAGDLQNRVYHNTQIMEQQFETIQKLEQNLITDSRLQSLAYDDALNAYERSQLIRSLYTHIQELCTANNSVEKIEIVFPKESREISTETGWGLKTYTALDRKGNDLASTLVYERHKLYMELLYPLTYSTDEEYRPDCGVIITLSQDYFREILQALDGGDTGAFLALEQQSGDPGVIFQTETNGTQIFKDWKAEQEKLEGAEQEGDETEQEELHSQGTKYVLVERQFPSYGVTVGAYCSWKAVDNASGWALVIMGGLLLCITVLFFAILYQTNNAVSRPLHEVVHAFGKVEEGNLDVWIYHEPHDEFGYIYAAFNRMVQRIAELMENIREQSRLLQNAELIQLQSQINPHFLYNSFYLIRIMAKNEDYDQITQFVTSLAKYYRFINKEVNQNIPLQREVEHMQNYIDIQQMRFGDKITVEHEALPAGVSEYRVPKLILQPIVENAYNYGMKDILEDGKIWIHYVKTETQLEIWIEDNGGGGTEEHLKEMQENIRDYEGRAAGHALSNIERRLKLAYGEGSGLAAQRSELGGVAMILRLDLTRTLE